MKKPKKSLGQNFLIDKNIIKKIINITKVYNKNIIEIGPGQGALTDEILTRKPKTLTLIEKDKNLFENLKKKYSKIIKVKILNADILELNLENFLKKDTIIFGNLPFNISSQILVKIVKIKKWPPKFSNLIFMFQKELGEKILGQFRSKNYGRLSILTNYTLNSQKKFYVTNNCFFPKPKVQSVVIHFFPKEKKTFKIRNIENLEKVTNVLFSGKRKMINKNLKKLLNQSDIEKIPNIKFNLRPSEISPEIYYKITELYEKK